MKTRDEPNIWKTLVKISLTVVIIFVSVYLYNYYFVEEDVVQDDPFNYSEYLLNNKEILLTPENNVLQNFTKEIINETINKTKTLNTDVSITIYRYLRESFGQIPLGHPRPPVETIKRGSGSNLDLVLLYTSVLLYLEYDAYTLFSDGFAVTVVFNESMVYIYDWTYYSPLEVDQPYRLPDEYDNVTVFSNREQLPPKFDFKIWSRSKIE
jgi:hypothetical protein